MRALILSDIHANLEALDAVLAAAQGKWDVLWNLGDTVGYGGAPNEVIDRIRPLQSLMVRGNHDRVCCGLTSPNGFNPVARTAALWTKETLTPENLEWLESAPQGPIEAVGQAVTCAHGSPLDEDNYILNIRDAWAPLQQMPTPITFFGHTHIQGGFSQEGHQWHELRPSISRQRYAPAHSREDRTGSSGVLRNRAETWTMELPHGTRHLINPGSVGQPRDFDWRAAFAILSSTDNPESPDQPTLEITFHRVPYDLISSQGRILMAGLPERLAARLREGR
jgi:predicted phosphodiesterase